MANVNAVARMKINDHSWVHIQIVANIALLVARRFRVPVVVISQDVFPEIAVQLKRLENPIVMSLLRGLVGLYLRRADRIVARKRCTGSEVTSFCNERKRATSAPRISVSAARRYA